MRHRVSAVLLAIFVSFWVPFSSTVDAENRYFLPTATLPAGGSGELLGLRLDNDVPVRAYAFGIHLDPAQLRLTGLSTAGTSSDGAEYLSGRLDAAAGVVGYGCVFAFSPGPEDVLPPGTNHLLIDLVVDVVGVAGTSTELTFGPVALDDNPIRPPVINMLTNDGGLTVLPSLAPGTIQLEDRAPRITEVTESTGRAGKVFRVAATFLREPNLAVSVCGVPASFTFEAGDEALLVTAPDCAGLGWSSLELCTIRGCDARAEGFEYLPPPETEFLRGNTNGDGDVDLSDGVWILLYLFQGGPPARCHDAMDANDDGSVDLSDAPYLFNFLFLGGPDVRPPYPSPGTDPTPDGLLTC